MHRLQALCAVGLRRRQLPAGLFVQQLLTLWTFAGGRGDSIPLKQTVRPHSYSRAGWMSYGAYDSNVAGSVAALWNAGAVSGREQGSVS